MDLPVWCMLAAVLVLAVNADPTDQGPQKFSDSQALEEKPVDDKKQHKRQPKYEEVILYLTPSQIRAYESGKGLMTHEQAAHLRTLEEGQGLRQQSHQAVQYGALEKELLGQPQQTSQFKSYEGGKALEQPQQDAKFPTLELEQQLQAPQRAPPVPHLAELDLSKLNEQFQQHMQNSYNSAGQNLQKEVKKIEVQQKEKIQLRESKINKAHKENEMPHISPEHSAEQQQKFDLQKREKPIEIPLPLQFIPQDWSHIQQQYGAHSKQLHFEPQFIAQQQIQHEPQLIPISELPQLKHLPLQHEKTQQSPQNYAYLYFYPHGKPVNNEKLQLFHPQTSEQRPKELFVQPEDHSVFSFHPKYQLVPYEYAYENKVEAQKILQAQLAEHELDAHRLEAHKLEAHQLEDFDAQQFLNHKHFEAHYQQQHKLANLQLQHEIPHLQPQHEIPHLQQQHEMPQLQQQHEIPHLQQQHEIPQLQQQHEIPHLQQQHEIPHLQQQHEIPQLQQQHEIPFAQEHKYKPQAQEHKYEPQELKLKIIPHTAALRAQPSKEIKIDLKKLPPLRQHEMKEIYEAQKLKAKEEKEEKEAQRLDEQLKEEELKAEQSKAEQLKEELFKNQEFRDELFKSPQFRDQLFRSQEFKDELFKSQEFRQELFNNQVFKDELFKQQEYKEEPFSTQEFHQEPFQNQVFKGEMFQSHQQSNEEQYQQNVPDLGYLQKQEPKKTQMYSILSPLFQGHSITESLQQQKNFPHHKINLETGFKPLQPLQYAPKFNDARYAREVEKLLKRNHVEKQKAMAKAAAIANEPSMVIRSEEKIVKEIIPSKPIIKHVEVPVPTPVMVPIPTPIEVKVPQPYPVPMEIIRPVPITIVKTEKVEVPKPVPIEIEKRIPVQVPKKVYVNVDKPYYVQKMVPVEIKREVPVETPVMLKTPLKLSIIKHVWN